MPQREALVRTRTVTWGDPIASARAAAGLPGLEFLERIQRGEIPDPPILRLLDIRLVAATAGRAVFEVEPAEYHYNPIGMVHAGLTCTLCDTAMGCAIHSLLDATTGYTTLELKVNLVRALTHKTGRVVCEGNALHVGRRTATAEARVLDERGTLYAHATCTCLLRSDGPK